LSFAATNSAAAWFRGDPKGWGPRAFKVALVWAMTAASNVTAAKRAREIKGGDYRSAPETSVLS
jgi:hypothetical protein